METSTIVLLIVAIAALGFLVMLVKTNRKDREKLNPGGDEAVDEIHNDQRRQADSI